MTEDPYDPVAIGGRDEPDEVDHSIPGDLVLLHGRPATDATGRAACWRRMVVLTPSPKPDWYAGEELDDWTPASASVASVRYRGCDYDVVRVGRRGSGMEYVLEPADPARLAHRLVEYGRAAELRRRSAESRFRRALLTARLAVPLYPLIGMLPADWQDSIAARLPIDVGRATLAACVAGVIAGGFLSFWQLAVRPLAGFVGRGGGTPAPDPLLWQVPHGVWMALGILLLVDGIHRWRVARNRHRLQGFIPLELLWRLLRGSGD